MAALGHVVHGRCLALPEIPVEFGRDGLACERAFAQPGGQPDINFLELADAAVADEFAGEAEALAAALLGAGLQDHLVVAHGLDHVAALIDGQGEGLLGVDVLLRAGGGDVDQAVPVVGRAVDDAVDVVALEQFPEIVGGGGGLAIFGEPLDGAVDVAFVHIADRDDIAETLAFLRIAAALTAATDQRDGGSAVRGFDGGGGLGGERHLPFDEPERKAGCRSGGRTSAKERAAGDLEGFVAFHEVRMNGFLVAGIPGHG